MMIMYSGVRKIFNAYWRAYGGWRDLVRSPYLHAALIMTALSYPMWKGGIAWWDTVIAVLPNLLGFTLGGFAMFIGFGDDKFRNLLVKVKRSEEEKPEDAVSIFESLCASFVHFIVVQIFALVFALLQKAWRTEVLDIPWWQQILPTLNFIGGMFGYLLFIYAVCLALAACMHVFRIAGDYAMASNYDY